MSGQIKSLISNYDELLHKSEKIILPINTAPGLIEEYDEYLRLSAQEVRAMSRQELAIIVMRLNQYSMYVQRCYNQEKSRVLYLKNKLKQSISKIYSSLPDRGSWEYRESLAIEKSPGASEINEQLLFHSCRLQRLDNISDGIKNIADTLRSIQYDKGRNSEIPQ